MVYCTKCGGGTKVTKTRERPEDNVQIRDRECEECGHRFKTVECAVAAVKRRRLKG